MTDALVCLTDRRAPLPLRAERLQYSELSLRSGIPPPR